MKKIFLLPVLTLFIASCGSSITSSNLISDISNSSDSELISESSNDEIVALAPIKIEGVYNEKTFTLEEFPDVTFRIGPRILNDDGSLYVFPLYVNDVRVTQETIDRLLFAYDVNKDGYRDLVFYDSIQHYSLSIVNGFDVHNMKKMENKLGIRQYRMDLAIEDGRVRAKAYTASTISSVTFDYAELAYSEEKGLYFVWDNMYQFKEFKLNRITLDDENKTVINPVVNDNGINYSLSASTNYIFEISAPREENPTITDFNFDRMSGLDVSVDDKVLSVNRFEYISGENGIYKYRINFRNEITEFTYKFVIPSMSFSINISLA